jgi:hypothetical protein
VLGDPAFAEVAVADPVRSAAAAQGRLTEDIRHLDSTRLLAETIITATPGTKRIGTTDLTDAAAARASLNVAVDRSQCCEARRGRNIGGFRGGSNGNIS